MVKIKNWDYPNDVMETVKINKAIREDVAKLCKEKGWNKSLLVEEFYKTILFRFKEGSLNASSGYITMNILRKPITK